MIGGAIINWLDADNNDVNLSLYEYITPTAFPMVNEVVCDFPVGPALILWASLLASSGTISSSDFGFMVRGYSW